jgi:hypothetical protein
VGWCWPKKPPTSRRDSLVEVVGGVGQENHQRVFLTCWWWRWWVGRATPTNASSGRVGGGGGGVVLAGGEWWRWWLLAPRRLCQVPPYVVFGRCQLAMTAVNVGRCRFWQVARCWVVASGLLWDEVVVLREVNPPLPRATPDLKSGYGFSRAQWQV